MRYIKFLVSFLLCTACNNSSNKTLYQNSTHEQIADKITAKVAQKIEKKTGLSLAGTGGGMMEQVRVMALSFNRYGEITLGQSRELLIYCVNEYLTAINENEEIRPYLIHYPFTPQDLEIRIFIFEPDRKDVPRGLLSIVSAIEGNFSYRTQPPGSDTLQRIHTETYEEAVKALKQNE